MVVRDEKFASSKRNRAGEYARTHSRGELESEVREIFRAQRRWGNVRAGSDLEDRYVGIAFHQRPLQDSESRVGFCPFETDERRCSRYAPSFERFRFLSKLNVVRLVDGGGNLRRLTAEERREAFTGFGLSAKSLSWNALAKKIGQSSGTVFEGVNEERAKKDVVRSSGCAAGTKTLCDALGPGGWALVDSTPARFDAVASVVSFREDLDRIEEGLVPLLKDLDSRYLDRLLGAVRAGTFGFFKGAGHVSSKAARAILPHLQEGQVYSQACASAGYAHWRSRRVGIEDLGSPVVQRSLREAVKQVETLVHTVGVRPGRIVVELAREVGKSSEERGKIERGMDRLSHGERTPSGRAERAARSSGTPERREPAALRALERAERPVHLHGRFHRSRRSPLVERRGGSCPSSEPQPRPRVRQRGPLPRGCESGEGGPDALGVEGARPGLVGRVRGAGRDPRDQGPEEAEPSDPRFCGPCGRVRSAQPQRHPVCLRSWARCAISTRTRTSRILQATGISRARRGACLRVRGPSRLFCAEPGACPI